METSTQFQLEAAINSYLDQLQTKGNYSSDDLLELKSHLQDNVDELKAASLSEEEAFIIAKKRLGKEAELSSEYEKVNGARLYNRDLFVIVVSFCLYFICRDIFTISTNCLQYFGFKNPQHIYLAGMLNYLVKFLLVGGFIYFVLRSGNIINRVSGFFIKSPANFSAIIIFLVACFYFLNIKSEHLAFLAGNNINTGKLLEKFNAGTATPDLVNSILGAAVLLAMLAAFLNSYKKIRFLQYLVNRSGYIAVFLLGFFWESLAACTRMLNIVFNDNTLLSATAFGIVWFAGTFIFWFYQQEKIILRIFVFLSFGLVLELAAGIWLNPLLRQGLPVSVFFIAMIAGSGLGILVGNFFKHRSTLMLSGN